MKTQSILTLAILSGCIVTACGDRNLRSKLKEEWNSANDPLRFLPMNFERSFETLPTSASLKKMPWSDTYWPTTAAGLAQRWNDTSITDNEENFKYKPYSYERLTTLSQAEMAKLSPAEKFDIFTGNYNYPLFSYEQNRTKPDAESWEGLCHGWASAAINFEEPKSVVVQNAHGLQIPFGAADVKGLLDLYSGNFNGGRYNFVGERCDIDLAKTPGASENPECRDTNAGTFHLVLTNNLGIQKRGFVADVSRDLQVWNQPIYAYSTQVVSEQEGASPGAAPGTVRETTVKTIMSYISESGPEWNAGVLYDSEREYNYRLELNANGQIIGGAWLEESRPDFLWMQEKSNFYDFGNIRFSMLKLLYKQSAESAGITNPAEQ